MRTLLDSWKQPALVNVLVQPFESVDERTARTVLASDIGVATMSHSAAWQPCTAPATHWRYRVFALRVSVLMHLWNALQAPQHQEAAEDAELRATRNKQQRKEECAEFVNPNTNMYELPRGEVDTTMHWLTHWLDAHWPLCCALEDVGVPLANDDPLWRPLLAELEPRLHLTLWEGTMPSAVPFVVQHLLLERPGTVSPFVDLVHRFLPRKAQSTAVLRECQDLVSQHVGTHQWFLAMFLATSLGVYRHARVRPSHHVRRVMYRAALYAPSPALVSALEEHHAARHSTFVWADVHKHAVNRVFGAPKRRFSRGTAVRPEAAYLLDAAANTVLRMSGNTMQTMFFTLSVREWIVNQVVLDQPLYSTLCDDRPWALFTQLVCDGTDAWRGSGYYMLDNKQWRYQFPSGAVLPSNVESFFGTFVKTVQTFLDKYATSTTPLHAMWTDRCSWVVEQVLAHAGYASVYKMRLVGDAPPTTGTLPQEWRRQNWLPLRAFGASHNAALIMEHHQLMYEASPQVDFVKRAIELLYAESIFELLVAYNVARVIAARQAVYTTAMPTVLHSHHVSTYTHDMGMAQTPCPTQEVSLYVCLNCLHVSVQPEGGPTNNQTTQAIVKNTTLDDEYRAAPWVEPFVPCTDSVAKAWLDQAEHVPRTTLSFAEHLTRSAAPVAPLHVVPVNVEVDRAVGALVQDMLGARIPGSTSIASDTHVPLRLVCGTKKIKTERRKRKLIHEEDVQDSQAVTVRRSARTWYETTLCRNRQLKQVPMLGYWCTVNGDTFGLCCTCLAPVNMCAVHWIGVTIHCSKCANREWRALATHQTRARANGMCIGCKSKGRSRETYRPLLVVSGSPPYTLEEASVCQRCFPTMEWAFAAPFLMHRDDIAVGVQAGRVSTNKMPQLKHGGVTAPTHAEALLSHIGMGQDEDMVHGPLLPPTPKAQGKQKTGTRVLKNAQQSLFT